MRQTTLAILLVFLSIPVWAQSDSADQQIIRRQCRSHHAHFLPGKYGQNYPVLFNEIRVLDARTDTSRIGIVGTGIFHQTEILLNAPAATELTQYLNTSYARPNSGHTLLIVLKDLWIAGHDDSLHKPGQGYDIFFRVEAWLQTNEGYKPLLRMDTVENNVNDEVSATSLATTQFRALFDEFMARIALEDLRKQAPIVSVQGIDSFNQTRFAYPMYTTKQLVKGVYRNVEEFLNNAPSIEKAELNFDSEGNSELSIPDENGQLYYTHTVWGYCDGNQVYVMNGGNLFIVFTIHHQFYVLGSKLFITNPLNDHGPRGPAAVPWIFRIDTRTGRVIE